MQILLLDVHPTLLSDDYTAYIANSRALLSGRPPAMPGYIVNPDYAGGADLGQAAYPVGFPMLIAPLVVLAQGDFTALLYTMALLNGLLLALFAYAFACLVRRQAGVEAGLVAGLVAGLSPFFLDQGAFRAPSDPGFLLAITVFFLLEGRMAAMRTTSAAALAGLAAGVAGLVRVLGGLLLPAAVLADLWRNRRITRQSVVLGAIGTAIILAGLAWMGADYFVRNSAIFRSGAGSASSAGGGLGAVVLHNLRDLPGNLSVLWNFGWRGDAAGAATPLHRVVQLLSAALLAIAAAGFVRRLRRGPGAAEVFAVLQTVFLLTLPPAQQSPRYYLPVSMLVLLYALVGCAAGARWSPWPRAPLLVLTGAILAMMATNLDDAMAARTDAMRFALTAPQAREATGWIARRTPPTAVLLAHHPRSFAITTGRSVSDFTSERADAKFNALIGRTGAGYLVTAIDDNAIRARARAIGQGQSDEALGRALDGWEADFFGPDAARFPILFRNARFRVHGIVEPPKVP